MVVIFGVVVVVRASVLSKGGFLAVVAVLAVVGVGAVRIHYVTAGQGSVVVLLHGWPQTWYLWRDVIPGLATRFRVVAPDLRGLGDSSRPPGQLAIESWRRVAADVRGGVADNCGHWIPEERPEWVVEQLLSFFGEAPI